MDVKMEASATSDSLALLLLLPPSPLLQSLQPCTPGLSGIQNKAWIEGFVFGALGLLHWRVLVQDSHFRCMPAQHALAWPQANIDAAGPYR